MNRAVFLDRDGVINRAPHNPTEGKRDSPYRLSEFRLLPGAKRAVRLLNEAGWLTVMVSNQPGVAKGKCTMAFLDEITERLKARLAAAGSCLDGIYYCLHHPDAIVPELRTVCDCRKPRPGLLLEAASDFQIDLSKSYIIGDGLEDIKAGRAAGCKVILVQAGSRRTDMTEASVSVVTGSLLEAVEQLLSEERGPRNGDLPRLC